MKRNKNVELHVYCQFELVQTNLWGLSESDLRDLTQRNIHTNLPLNFLYASLNVFSG